MANIHFKPDREAALKAFAKQNGISLSFLMQKLTDAFFANPTIFLEQFTINGKLHQENQTPEHLSAEGRAEYERTGILPTRAAVEA